MKAYYFLIFLMFFSIGLWAQNNTNVKKPTGTQPAKTTTTKPTTNTQAKKPATPTKRKEKISDTTFTFSECTYKLKIKIAEDSCDKEECKYYLDFNPICPEQQDCKDGNSVVIRFKYKSNGKWSKERIVSKECNAKWTNNAKGFIGTSKTNPKKEYKIVYIAGYTPKDNCEFWDKQ